MSTVKLISFDTRVKRSIKPTGSMKIIERPSIFSWFGTIDVDTTADTDVDTIYYIVPAKQGHLKILMWNQTQIVTVRKFDPKTLTQPIESSITYKFGDTNFSISNTSTTKKYIYQLNMIMGSTKTIKHEFEQNYDSASNVLFVLLGCGSFSWYKTDGVPNINMVIDIVYKPVYQELIRLISLGPDPEKILCLLKKWKFYCFSREEQLMIKKLSEEISFELGIVTGDLCTIMKDFKIIGSAPNKTLTKGNGSWGIQHEYFSPKLNFKDQCSEFTECGIKTVALPKGYLVLSHAPGAGNNGGAAYNSRSEKDWIEKMKLVLAESIISFLLCQCFDANLDHEILKNLHDNLTNQFVY